MVCFVCVVAPLMMMRMLSLLMMMMVVVKMCPLVKPCLFPLTNTMEWEQKKNKGPVRHFFLMDQLLIMTDRSILFLLANTLKLVDPQSRKHKSSLPDSLMSIIILFFTRGIISEFHDFIGLLHLTSQCLFEVPNMTSHSADNQTKSPVRLVNCCP